MVFFPVVSLFYLIKTERGSIFKRVLNYYYHNLALRYMQYMSLSLFCLFVFFLLFHLILYRIIVVFLTIYWTGRKGLFFLEYVKAVNFEEYLWRCIIEVTNNPFTALL